MAADLRSLPTGTEVGVNTYIRLSHRYSLIGGNVLKVRGTNPKTGALILDLWVPKMFRRNDREWKSFEVNGETVERLGRHVTVTKGEQP